MSGTVGSWGQQFDSLARLGQGCGDGGAVGLFTPSGDAARGTVQQDRRNMANGCLSSLSDGCPCCGQHEPVAPQVEQPMPSQEGSVVGDGMAKGSLLQEKVWIEAGLEPGRMPAASTSLPVLIGKDDEGSWFGLCSQGEFRQCMANQLIAAPQMKDIATGRCNFVQIIDNIP
jgi:hypothetical protein